MPILRVATLMMIVVAFYLAAIVVGLLPTRLGERLADRLAVAFCRSVLRTLRTDVRMDHVSGGGNNANALMLANHVSWMDIMVIGSLRPASFLAKSDVAAWPLIARFARMQGAVFVDRKRKRSIIPANQLLSERLKQNRLAVIFPEGTTTDGTTVGCFRSSHVQSALDAFRTRPAQTVCLQPLAIAYNTAAAAWVGDQAFLPHLWSIVLGDPITCTLRFAEPIDVTLTSDRKSLTRAAQHAVGACLTDMRAIIDCEAGPNAAMTFRPADVAPLVGA